MEKTPNEPRSLILSSRLYQALLSIYPSDFRHAYGGPMRQVFRDCCLKALGEQGATGLLALWMRTMLDTVQTAIEEHSQRGVDMSKEKFFQMSGWALMLGPVLFLIGSWANNRPAYSPYNAASLPIDRYTGDAAAPITVAGLVFMSLGLFGMQMRFSPKWNNAGILLGSAALSGLVSAIGVAGLAVNDSSPWWELFLLGLVVQFTALAIFGLISLRQRLLPRWNGLPVLAFWLPVVLALSMGITPWEVSAQLTAVLWIVSCVMFAGLGHLLRSDPRPASRATPAV